jgi:hypothetical protein
MATAKCPKCGNELTLRPGVLTTCGCGAKLRPKGDAPMVQAVDDVSARPRRQRDEDDDSGPGCPQCGSRQIENGPWPWYLGTVGAFLCKAVVCQDCGHEFDLYKPQADLAKRKLHLALAINGVGLVGIIVVIGTLIMWIRYTMNH